jgi:hypothetical protein
MTREADGLGLRVVADDVRRGERLIFTFDGQPVTGFRGESIAAALLANGLRALRTTHVGGEPRGIYCGMGVCFDCLVVVDGEIGRRACITPVAAGLRVETLRGNGDGQ